MYVVLPIVFISLFIGSQRSLPSHIRAWSDIHIDDAKNYPALLASGGERRDAKRRVDRRRELPLTVIWENRTT